MTKGDRRRHRRLIWGPVGVLIAAAVGLFVWLGQQQAEKYAGPVNKITFGVETSFLTAPVWIAESKGYFEDEGLIIEIKEFASGRTALATMLNDGNLDMVTVAQTPVMFNSFKRDDYAIIAAMVHSDNDVKVLARRDKGINDSSDLRGKKIGITRGSTGHFFLGLLLIHSDMKLSEIEIIDVEASALPQALADGTVDAISTWEPHILNAKKLLGDNAILIQPPGGGRIFREDFYFVPNRNFMESNPDTLKRFLRAVEKGETFIKTNKEEAIHIVSQRLKIDKELVATAWKDFQFELLLDQSILLVLEDEARWAIRNNLVDATETPNYVDYIYTDALEAVKPEAVTIIR